MIGDCNGDARPGSCRKSDPRTKEHEMMIRAMSVSLIFV
jgi:hypothetical protein